MSGEGGVPASLEVRHATKTFPGVKALDDVSIAIRPHEVVGLIGENGAGKSTLLKVLSGIYPLDAGEILVDGRPVRVRGPRDAFDHGIAMVFQEQSVLPSLTVAENIFLAREQEFVTRGLISKRRMNAAARAELAKVHLDIDPATPCGTLSFAQRQMVEIAKALSLDSRISADITILLDEPTSVLESRETELLFDIIRDLRSRAAIVFISHRLDEVLAISDRVYVMRDGRVVKEVGAGETTIPELHGAMVGRQLSSGYYREARQRPGGPRATLEVDRLSRHGAFHNVSFTLHEGEVLGIAGVVGSGREALARCLAGLMPPDSGTVRSDGRVLRLDRAHRAVGAGIGFMPAERKIEGIVGPLSVAENMTLAATGRYVARGLLQTEREAQTARSWIERLHIKTPSPHTPAGSLSGGNQQKVVFSKWRIAGCRILILDHPTRGIDVGAKEDIYDLVRDMTDEGLSILLLADTLEEVIGLSTRILVMKDGRVTAVFEAPPNGKPDQVQLISHMV